MTSIYFKDVGKHWRLQSDDFAGFRAKMGDQILTSFCRCFVHADRLASLMHFIDLVVEQCPHDSVAATRDQQSMVWLAVGTLREYALAIQKLRASLAKEDLLEKDSNEWRHLMEFERRREKQRY